MKFKRFKTRKKGKYKCMLCGACIASCPKDALEFRKSKENITYDDMIIHHPSKCNGCGLCAKACPEGMIKIKN